MKLEEATQVLAGFKLELPKPSEPPSVIILVYIYSGFPTQTKKKLDFFHIQDFPHKKGVFLNQILGYTDVENKRKKVRS